MTTQQAACTNPRILLGGSVTCSTAGESILRAHPSGLAWLMACTGGGQFVGHICGLGVGGVYERRNDFATISGGVRCDPADRVIAGGCNCGVYALVLSAPLNATEWQCQCAGATGYNYAYALCMPAATYSCLNGQFADSGKQLGSTTTVSCQNSGQLAIAGGCSTPGGSVAISRRLSANTWQCKVNGSEVRAWVSCVDGS